jgi:trk system potassium uptake protein TrkA
MFKVGDPLVSPLVHVVILGCGRVGSTLARSLARRSHSVAVIDQDAKAFDRLGEDFNGQIVTGVGFDRDTLKEAGIERADAFAAVSSGDNSNILSARVARETFGVEHVVARIYDPKRAEVYERLGIPTVATVRWTADQIMRRNGPTRAAGSSSLRCPSPTVGSASRSPRWKLQRRSASRASSDSARDCFPKPAPHSSTETPFTCC